MHFEKFDSIDSVHSAPFKSPTVRTASSQNENEFSRGPGFAFQDEGLYGGILPKLSLIPELSNNARSCSNRSLAHRKQSSDVICSGCLQVELSIVP